MKKIILSSLLLVALVSCKKEKVVGPQGPAGTNGTNGSGTTGTITGKVTQYDQYGTVYTTGLNTTTVSVDGTTNIAITDAAGNFTISNLPPGVYDISYQKPNCGLYKKQQITFPGNGTLRINESISDKATHTITTCILKDTTVFQNSGLKFQTTYPSNPKNRWFAIFFSKTNAIDPSNLASYESYYSLSVSGNSTTNTIYIYYNNYPFANFTSGTTIYAKVFPDTYQSFSYYDYTLDESYHTGTGTPFPTTFTFTMP